MSYSRLFDLIGMMCHAIIACVFLFFAWSVIKRAQAPRTNSPTLGAVEQSRTPQN